MKLSGLLLVTIISGTAHGAVTFTNAEIDTHQKNINTITSTASKCLESVYADHLQFFKKWHVSKYYGDRNPILSSRDLRQKQLRNYGAPASLEPELEPTSCIGLTVKCLSEGFAAAGQQSTWKKIITELRIDGKMYGGDLQIMLRQLGWKLLYWNPDPSKNEAWDKQDQALNPLHPGKVWNAVWGGHAYNFRRVMSKNIYDGATVDDKTTLVDFKETLPEAFTSQPFFVGVAHSGYHVFPGRFGKVIEAHSMRKLNSIDNLQVSPFNPLATGGGPRWTASEKYRSGLIAVPPKQK